jgi:large subunit ribosomal protein L6
MGDTQIEKRVQTQGESRIGKLPISVPAGIEIVLQGQNISFKNNRGSLEHKAHRSVDLNFDEATRVLKVSEKSRAADAKKFVGTTRAVLYNIVYGLDKGFEKKLKLVGVGYRAAMEGQNIKLSLGYSNPVIFKIPSDWSVKLSVPDATTVLVSGVNKVHVGQVAANIRSLRKPDSYKGKGVRYVDEVIILKEVKK